jgi:hypothetical protein
VIRAYMLRGGRRPASTQLAREARDYFGVSADPTIDEIRSVADRYPVFRVVRGWSGSRAGEPRQAAAPAIVGDREMRRVVAGVP